MTIKTTLLTVLCSMLVCSAGAQAAEVKLDFTVESGGGYNQSSMTTSASGISGDIVWTAEYASYPWGAQPDYYHMEYLIDEHIATGTYDHYWMTNTPGFLRIDFSESVYITKIRTYNVVDNTQAAYYGKRWAESILKTSTDGTNFTQAGNIDNNSSPSPSDYVDIYINGYVTSILFEDNLSSPFPDFYAFNEIEFYTGTPVPEPASIMLLIAGCAALVRRLRK